MSGWSSDVQQQVVRQEQGAQASTLEAGIALLQQNGSGSAKAKSLLQPLANEGNSRALLWLGRAYRDGLGGMEKDIKKSFEYFQKAGGHEGLNPEAQMELGRAYQNGEGTDRNLIAAYMWTALSAEKQGSWTREAVRQRDDLQNSLTPAQQEKAKQLVEQLRSIYLKNP